MILLPSARNPAAENAGVNASVVIKSPSKVLGPAALDAWENDFTRLQHEVPVVSPTDTVSYLTNRECDDDTLAVKREQEPSNALSCSNFHDGPSVATSRDNDGDDNFCFQCFNHDCKCLVDCCIDSADASTNTDNAKSVDALSDTSYTEYAASFSGGQSPSPTGLPHSDEYSVSPHSPEVKVESAYNKLSHKPNGVNDTFVVQNESRQSSDDRNDTSEYQELEEDIPPTARTPAPTEYALKHHSLDNSTSHCVSIVPSNETIMNLLPRLVLDIDLNGIQISNAAATWNQPRSPNDLYSPRWQRGIGAKKEGLCPLCDPTNDVSISVHNMWLKTKTSRFWYHMNFYHGISASNGRPYSPPVRLRAIEREHTSNTGKRVIIHQGYCGQCGQWVDLQAKQPLMVPELKVGRTQIVTNFVVMVHSFKAFTSGGNIPKNVMC